MDTVKKSSTSALNPLPLPIKRFSSDQSPTWPTNQKGYYVYFHGKLNASMKCVTIDDASSSYLLDKMGSFGRSLDSSEPKTLDLVEAYFLSYALGILVVVENDTKYCLDESWVRFCELDDKFAALYAVYHLYRSKGWVVRKGSQLGTTFTLYKEGPQYNHARYALDVHSTPSEDLGTFNNWQSLLAKYRVVKSVSKDLLVANVMFKGNELDLSSPKCISHFHVITNLVTRRRCHSNMQA